MKNIIIPAVLLFLYSCSSNESPVRPSPKKVEYAHGKVNQILVVADEELWEGPVGDTFSYYFGGPYLMLPQPEPIFDIKHLTPEELAKQTTKKEFRTILFLADVEDDYSQTAEFIRADLGQEKVEETRKNKGYNTIIGKDKWARNQILFYVFGIGENKLVENIALNFPPIARRINEADLVTVEATTYQAGENSKLETEIKEKFGADIKLPGDFRKAYFDTKTNTLWLRRDVRDIIANILVHRRPYSDKSQLTKEGVKAIRDEIGKIITSQQPNSFMRINDVDLPMLTENKTLNNRYTLQAKGIWEMENDFKGGPFLSNLMLNPETNQLLLIDAFILAPGEEKRNFMQEMELILSSVKF